MPDQTAREVIARAMHARRHDSGIPWEDFHEIIQNAYLAEADADLAALAAAGWSVVPTERSEAMHRAAQEPPRDG